MTLGLRVARPCQNPPSTINHVILLEQPTVGLPNRLTSNPPSINPRTTTVRLFREGDSPKSLSTIHLAPHLATGLARCDPVLVTNISPSIPYNPTITSLTLCAGRFQHPLFSSSLATCFTITRTTPTAVYLTDTKAFLSHPTKLVFRASRRDNHLLVSTISRPRLPQYHVSVLTIATPTLLSGSSPSHRHLVPLPLSRAERNTISIRSWVSLMSACRRAMIARLQQAPQLRLLLRIWLQQRCGSAA